MFIGENFLITVSGYHSENRKPMNGIESFVEFEIENARKGPAFLMHVIMDHIVDQKFHAIEAMEDELEEAEEILLSTPATFNPAELVRLRRYLLNLRKSLFHEREILVKICRMDCPFIGEKAVFHFRDIYDHLAKFLELTETYREIVTSLMELYTSLLNNLMTKASNETNLSVRQTYPDSNYIYATYSSCKYWRYVGMVNDDRTFELEDSLSSFFICNGYNRDNKLLADKKN